MLQLTHRVTPAFGRDEPEASPLDFAKLFEFARRNRWRIAGTAFVFALLGVAYALLTPPRYTSSALILLDAKRAQIGLAQQAALSDPTAAAAAADSQVEVVRSDGVILSTIRKLDLIHDPEFRDPPSNPLFAALRAIPRLFVSGRAMTDEEVERLTIDSLADNLKVRRVGVTFVIELSYTASSPQKAEEIANAIADSYINDELEAKYSANRRAGQWLQDRIGELRDKATAAERAVQNYKAENKIVDTSRGQVLEQQISDLSTQLITTRTQTAESKARLDRINEILRTDATPDGTITDAVKSDVVIKLRQQLLDLRKREAEFARRYGATHQAVINLHSEGDQVQRSLNDELSRYLETFKSDYEIARTREQSLEASMNDLVAKNGEVRQAEIKLRELESSAQVYRTLFESFLQRYTEASQQQTFPISEARVITPASLPLRKSAPKSTLIVLGCAFVGMLAGAGWSVMRDFLDASLRAPSDVEALTGLDCVATVPRARPARVAADATRPLVEAASGRSIAAKVGLLRQVFDEPFSSFAEGVRSTKVSMDLTRTPGRATVVGVISSVPGEGKSLIASNLAQMIGQSGQRCILLDCDLRRPSLTNWLAPDATGGLLDVLRGRASVVDIVYSGNWGSFDFMPCVGAQKLQSTESVLASDAMRRLIADLSHQYDYVLIDLPPIAPVVDASAISPHIDRFLFVVEWGKTDRNLLAQSLRQMPEPSRAKVLGVVLNKVDVRRASDATQHYGRYYSQAYGSAYTNAA